MASNKSSVQARLEQLKSFISQKIATSIPFDPDFVVFPKRKDVPQASYSPPGFQTSWFWGADDNLGRITLLTPARVKAAASSEIQTGEMVSLKYPQGLSRNYKCYCINTGQPSFERAKYPCIFSRELQA